MNKKLYNPKVDQFLNKANQWRSEFEQLRAIIFDCQLTEELKWGVPCYTFNNANIVLIHGFKAYCAILFIKGALLSDKKEILIKQTKNVQAGRHVRFTNVNQIIAIKDTLKAYINEAIQNEKAGLKVVFNNTAAYSLPEELQNKFKEMPDLKTAFETLTGGRQRAYIFYFSQPKQSKTREARIEKYVQQILNGKGLDD